MERILLLFHTEPGGSGAKPALETLAVVQTLASELAAGNFTVGLIGPDIQFAAHTIATCGATRFFGVTGPDFAQARYSTDALAAETIVRAAAPTLVLAPGTARWSRVLPGVAQRVGGRIDTHAVAVKGNQGTLTVNRWFYRQRMEAALQRTTRPWFVLAEPGIAQPWHGQPATAAIESLTPAVPDSCRRTAVLGIRELPADAQTIRPDADLLFVAGAGWTKKQADGQTHVPEAEKLISTCLKLTRASLGSSKSLVDLSGEGQAVLSFVSHLNQVGQTGATPRHPKGLSTCCHGEEPHTVGWRFIDQRRAISLDPNCGWARGKADVLYVADAFAVIAKLNQLLQAASS